MVWGDRTVMTVVFVAFLPSSLTFHNKSTQHGGAFNLVKDNVVDVMTTGLVYFGVESRSKYKLKYTIFPNADNSNIYLCMKREKRRKRDPRDEYNSPA